MLKALVIDISKMKKNQKSKNVISDREYMDSINGENLVKNYVIYEDRKYYIHPIYDQYGASKSGKVIE